MRHLWEEIDLHVAFILLLVSPVACLGWSSLIVPLLVPQGRIGVRAFWDYPSFGQRPWAYLAANELLVLVAVAVLAGVRVAFTAVWPT